ncbi:hypothetical protein SLEP1_g43958 [Rubroshorea leprosula]|uniref:Uncharacterized protein n=1 Tax=Rubroshorea leprosula TaxID=152421 RepID=A0AAV5LF37_9ROSI|nr:hypothetical protein SLEP1_g43958 [Rubroshorea leprosula]
MIHAAYLFVRTGKKDTGITEEDATKGVPSTPVLATAVITTLVTKKHLSTPSMVAPEKLPEPIPENQQREPFKWILEEKRKLKPTDPEAKKRLDEEKALLKQFIRAKSIPSI